jgi:hypothetical protein
VIDTAKKIDPVTKKLAHSWGLAPPPAFEKPEPGANRSYQGRRFATPELKAYKLELSLKLPTLTIAAGPLPVRYVFGVSSKNADCDTV